MQNSRMIAVRGPDFLPRSTSRTATNKKLNPWIKISPFYHLKNTFGITNTDEWSIHLRCCAQAQFCTTNSGQNRVYPLLSPNLAGTNHGICVSVCVCIPFETHIFILAKYEINIPTHHRSEKGRPRAIYHVYYHAIVLRILLHSVRPALTQYIIIIISYSSVCALSKEILSMGFHDVSKNERKRNLHCRRLPLPHGLLLVASTHTYFTADTAMDEEKERKIPRIIWKCRPNISSGLTVQFPYLLLMYGIAHGVRGLPHDAHSVGRHAWLKHT